MRAGWNQRLKDELQRGDSSAGLIAEVVVVESSDIKNTREDWGAGTRENVTILKGGGVGLTPSQATRVSFTTETDPTDIVRLTNGPPFDGILIEWYGSSARNREIRNFTARLHPRVDPAYWDEVPEEDQRPVAAWVCEIFRVTRIGDDDISVERIRSREVEETGFTAKDVTFVFSGYNNTHPRVGDPPEGSGTGRPMTIIRIVAVTATGRIAENVAWEGSSTDGDFDNESNVYDLWHYTFNDLPGTSNGTEWFIQQDRDDLPWRGSWYSRAPSGSGSLTRRPSSTT